LYQYFSAGKSNYFMENIVHQPLVPLKQTLSDVLPGVLLILISASHFIELPT